MQVRQRVIQLVTVNVVDDLTGLRTGNFSMFPLTAASLGSVSQSKRLNPFVKMPVALLNGGTGNFGDMIICNGGNHLISSPVVLSMRKSANLLFVGVKRVAMVAKHLVVPHAKVLGDCRSVTMFTGQANRLTAPSVVESAMLLQPLIVHEAETSSGVLPTAAFNVANSIFNRRHKPSMLFPISYIGKNNGEDNSLIKIMGNSWAVPKFVWLGRRIQQLMPVANDNQETTIANAA
ncbi:hypothetical protein [Agrobacterium pusense]|uniref:hypothetical protein n=1 Tax=Agrobacterium pusense TaxID=648995 RepID=UPI00068CB4A4|nr:hypothetical protein [Agrobacterium pusense]ANV24489.1 hypothetical protein BA939_11445 [Rhizobium sp. S41]QWW75507.1 hypothetical protein KP800_01165 [Agrobacterium pusense]